MVIWPPVTLTWMVCHSFLCLYCVTLKGVLKTKVKKNRDSAWKKIVICFCQIAHPCIQLIIRCLIWARAAREERPLADGVSGRFLREDEEMMSCHWSDGLSITQLTLNDEIDLWRLGLLFGLDGAGIRPLVEHIHLLYPQTVLQLTLSHQLHPRVQRPLILTREDDVRAVQPGHLRHLIIHITPDRETDSLGLLSHIWQTGPDTLMPSFNQIWARHKCEWQTTFRRHCAEQKKKKQFSLRNC